MNKRISEKLGEHFSKIRRIVGDAQKATVDAIGEFVTEDIKRKKVYNEETLRHLREQAVSTTTANIITAKESAKRKADAEIMRINDILREWLTEPIPDDVQVLLTAFQLLRQARQQSLRKHLQLLRQVLQQVLQTFLLLPHCLSASL